MSARLYLDFNASAPPRPQAIAAMNAALGAFGNASAPHGHGRAASRLVENARTDISLAMGVCRDDLIFTGSGTEAINSAIFAAVAGGHMHVITTALDHPASLFAAKASGAHVTIIPALKNGLLDLDFLNALLQNWDEANGAPFLTMTAANSETGVILGAAAICEKVQAVGGRVLVDAVQALGKTRMDFMPDYMAVSAHKIGGPQGVGALYIAPGAPFSSHLHGGGQEKRRRAGTLNVAGIAGFGAAAALCEGSTDHCAPIRDAIEAGLRQLEPQLTIFGEDVPRLPNTSLFAVPDRANSTLMMGLDLEGVSISTGMACSSGKVGASRAITAMRRADDAPHGALRLSLGYSSKMEDAERFLAAWKRVRRL